MKNFSKEFNFTMLIIVLILITLAAGAGLAVNEQVNKKPETPKVESALTQSAKEISGRVYKYKDTKYENTDKINSIVNNLDFASFPFVVAEPSQNRENIVTLNYRTDSRARFRIMSDYNRNFYQTVIAVFSLVKDSEGIRVSVADDYGEFYSFFVQRSQLQENTHTRAFTVNYLENATKDEETFVKFVENLLTINIPVEGKAFERKIYKVIPSNLELVEGSATALTTTLSNSDCRMLSDLGADTSDCLNRNCEIRFYSVNDYIQNEISHYIFIFADGELVAHAKLEDEKARTELITKLN